MITESTLYCVLRFAEFGAAVAAAYDPQLRGRPYVVVRQSSESHKCVAWSASAAAKALGVVAGMPALRVAQNHSGVAVVQFDPELHAAACDGLRQALLQFTPDVRVERNGACTLDLSRTPLARDGSPRRAAQELCAAVVARTGLERPATGIASGRLLARLLARTALPSGVCVCSPGDEEKMLRDFDTQELPGLSAPCRERLKKYGLRRVGQVQQLGAEALALRFGAEGGRLFCLAHGIDKQYVGARREPLAVEVTLDHDSNDSSLLSQHLRRSVDRFCYAARRTGLAVHKVRLSILFTDGKKTQKTIAVRGASNDYCTVAQAVERGFAALYVRRVGIRSITLAENALAAATGQTELFATDHDLRQERLGESIFKVREKNDFDAVFSGGDYAAYKNE